MDINLEKNHEKFLKIIAEAAVLRRKKLQDYGLSYKEHGAFGLVIRLHDKMSRLLSLYKTTKDANFESKRDNAVDIINYAVMLVMEIDEEGLNAN